MENAITLTEKQKQEIQEAVNKLIQAFELVMQEVKKAIEAFKEICAQIWDNLKDFINRNEKARKYLKIHNITHNLRIKKKQITKILKLLE